MAQSAAERSRFVKTFALTSAGYAAYYFARKALANSKKPMQVATGISPSVLGWMEVSYQLNYALGQYVFGRLGDRIGARRVLTFGMIATAVACALLGASSLAGAFLIANAVHGFTQASGWTGSSKAMAATTEQGKRGAVMGLWFSLAQIGGIVSAVIATYLLEVGGWRVAFFGPSIFLVLYACFLWYALPEPARPGAVAPAEAHDSAEARADALAERESRRRLFRSPALWSYGASYFFVKLIRYSLFGWLSYYLQESLGYSTKLGNLVSVSFEVGGLVGGITIGSIADRLTRVPPALVASCGLLMLAPVVLLYRVVGAQGPAVNFAVMALVGVFLFGPDALISGAAAQDLGGARSAGTAAGVINGIGALGAAAQGPLIIGLSGRFGWGSVFTMLIVAALFGAAALVPAILTTRDRTRDATA